MAPAWLREVPGGVELAVYVQPRASKTRVQGEHDGALKLSLAAPPVDGAANAALVEFVADALCVPRRQVELVSGDTGRRKRLHISGVSAAQVCVVMTPR